jgi:hypothetical protein
VAGAEVLRSPGLARSGPPKTPTPAPRRQATTAKTLNQQAQLPRQIDATDRQIDRRVYELYGLTEEEIKIVEEAGAK